MLDSGILLSICNFAQFIFVNYWLLTTYQDSRAKGRAKGFLVSLGSWYKKESIRLPG